MLFGLNKNYLSKLVASKSTSKSTKVPKYQVLFVNPLMTVHIKTAKQRITIQQYGDWYTDHWLVGCCIWYNEDGHGRAWVRPVPSSLYQM